MNKETLLSSFALTLMGILLTGCGHLTTPAPFLPTESNTATAGLPTQISAQSIILSGHTSAITHLNWSPDGTLLASSCGNFQSQDFTVRLWHPDGTPANILTGHTQPVTGLSWSPEGKTLASSSLDGTIRIWSSEGSLLKVLQGNAGQVFAVAWSPNEKILASGSIVTFTNPTVQLWDPEGQLVTTLSTSFSGGKFYNLAWSPDGKYLLGGATDYKLWQANGEQVYWLTACASCTPAWGMAWSPDSRLWAIGNESGEVEIYTNDGTKVATVHDQTGINSLAWSPDSRILAGAKTLWLADGTVFSTSNSQSGYVNSVAWSPDGKMLATGGSDNIVHLWTPDGKSLDLLQGHTGVIEVVAWSPNGNILASGSDDATIRLWTFK